MTAPSRYGAAREEVDALLRSRGEPAYRADQLWDGLYRQRLPLDRCTSLSKSLRARLGDALPPALAPVAEATGDRDATTKWLWECGDGVEVETVLMTYPDRATVCVSSQAGCAMGCTFCATGQAGFDRHLDVGEIVEQVMRAAHASTRRLDNVVFMGMGEPLANYDHTMEAVRRLHDDAGISARRITISTVGVVPGMRRLADERLPVTLAVSLHAATDELRDTLVPVNRRWPIGDVLDAAASFQRVTGRRVSIEYACIGGVNDDLEQAAILAERLRAVGPPTPHVNVIPLNPTAGFRGHAPNHARMETFARRLRVGGVNATIRRNRGTDIDAACGQLRARHEAGSSASVSVPLATGQNGATESDGPSAPRPEVS